MCSQYCGMASTSGMSTVDASFVCPLAIVLAVSGVSFNSRFGSVKQNVVPYAKLTLHSDAPSVPLYHALDDGQPNPRPLVVGLQPLKNLEDLLEVLRVDAHAVVAHLNDILGLSRLGARLLRAADLDHRVRFVVVPDPNERRYSTLSCSSASRHEGTVVITTTVASVIAAIHAA